MNSTNPIYLARSRSGGWSAPVDMMQGQKQPSPGPRVLFHSEQRETIQDPITGEFRTGDRIPVAETYTIRFGVQPPNAGVGGVPLAVTFDAYARIASKVAGNIITRYMSIGFATAVTVTAEGIDVDIFDQTSTDFIPTINDLPAYQPYRVVVQATPGLRASFETPPTLKGLCDVLNGSVQSPPLFGVVILGVTTGFARYPIPVFNGEAAGIVSVEVVAVNDPNTAPASVTVTAYAGELSAKQWDPTQAPGFVVLPPNTTYIEVTNTADTLCNVTLTWGVEG